MADRDGIHAIASGTPEVAESTYIAPGAHVIGAVTLGERTSVWYSAVVRGDVNTITIGDRSNVQDNVSIHVDAEHPAVIGTDVSIGHNAVVHGCEVGDGCLIGMGAVVLSGAVIGAGSLVAGGAVVLGGTVVPSGSLVAGVPAKVRRPITDEERAGLVENAARYLEITQMHRGV
ncbi:gamma carbonic anhydrase family protein [Microbacterium gorillae]|uniref:gamma carbonic anhydrase family protein n=1 Tax=Microbacterium gorillae TaxID=1231063 RepID=UPI0006938551|nr:gamma carbonic anhydrase family protein [Microbacterium gorillae]